MYLSSIFANGINAAQACEHSLRSCSAFNGPGEEVLAQLICALEQRGVLMSLKPMPNICSLQAQQYCKVRLIL